jgi:hypothetical protein
MDPVTLGAVLLAIVSGAAGELGSRLWDKISALVRAPHRRGAADPALSTGGAAGITGLAVGDDEAVLTALGASPSDRDLALALARVLVARANTDTDFARELDQWWEQASQVRIVEEVVTNTISGGTQHGPVLQGRDFSGLKIRCRSRRTWPSHERQSMASHLMASSSLAWPSGPFTVTAPMSTAGVDQE